jgi:uncharacterized protein (DUF433 family)
MTVKGKQFITINPKIRFGKPIITGTRVPVDLVVSKVAGGMTINEIKSQYDLTQDQIMAALQYASALVSQEDILPA